MRYGNTYCPNKEIPICNPSVSRIAKLSFGFMSSKCIPEDEFVSLAIGKWHTHPSHSLVLYGRVMLCIKCGSTALNKIVNLNHVCLGATPDTGTHSLINLRRYSQGRAPSEFLGRPFRTYKTVQNDIIRNIQHQVDMMSNIFSLHL